MCSNACLKCSKNAFPSETNVGIKNINPILSTLPNSILVVHWGMLGYTSNNFTIILESNIDILNISKNRVIILILNHIKISKNLFTRIEL